MFFKKRKVSIDSIGELNWVNGFWHGEYHYLNKDIALCLEGGKEAPEIISIENLKLQISKLHLQIALAEEYIESINIVDFKEAYGQIVLDAISVKSEYGLFDLEFGFTIWEDWLHHGSYQRRKAI